MINLSRCTTVVCLLAVGTIRPVAAQVVPLKPVSAFSTMSDEHARSVALFVEAARVIASPRCMNCHPATRQPTQGDDLQAHVPLMYGGPHDRGAPGLPCASCHGATNALTLASSIPSVPGNSQWRLAPASMAWQGRSLREICLQVKDGARNGGRGLSKTHEHVAAGPLVGWAWDPREGRGPPPRPQAPFGAAIPAWSSPVAPSPP